MAAPQLMAGRRARPQHQLRAAAKVGHQPGKLQVKLADAPASAKAFSRSIMVSPFISPLMPLPCSISLNDDRQMSHLY